MSAFITADWSPFGKDNYIRKFEIYAMGWEPYMDLKNIELITTQFGGPIALTRDRKKLIEVQGEGKPIIKIYTASGNEISKFIWNSGKVINFGWSSQCNLLCIHEDGYVSIFNIMGNRQHIFTMGQEVQDVKVKEGKVFNLIQGTGVAVLTRLNTFFLTNNILDPSSRKFPHLPSNVEPTAWIVVREDNHSLILAACEKKLYSLNYKEQKTTLLKVDFNDDLYSIIELASTSNYEKLAVMTNRGKIWIGTMKLECLRVFDLIWRTANIPQQLLWSGNDAVLVNLGETLEVIGLEDEYLCYEYDTRIFCVQEIDCARVISSQSHDMLQKVPDVVRDIFKINSTAPGAYLFEASKQFKKKNHRANEYLQLVKPKLFTATMQCISAAGFEFNKIIQKLLMTAAQFGKVYLDDCSPDDFVDMVKIIRCLNSLREPKIGIPLTFTELKTLKLQGMLDLLVNSRHYYLALELATFMKMQNSSEILHHWARYKIEQRNIPADKLAVTVAQKLLQSKTKISFKIIAEMAEKTGRKDLAIKLIEYEPRATYQVPFLEKLGEHEKALTQAIDSGNPDLINSVIFHRSKEMPKQEFLNTIRKHPVMQALYIKHCKQFNKRDLIDIYDQSDVATSYAEWHIREYMDPSNKGMKEASLTAALEKYKQLKNDVNASLCEDQIKLYKCQKSLTDKFRQDFIGKTLHETIKILLTLKEVKLANNLRSDYKVPDRRYWWLRLQVLGKLKEWSELEKFSKSKKSPIGYEAFVDICCNNDKKDEAKKYLKLIKEELKVKYLVKLGLFEEAAQTAFEQKDLEALIYVKSTSPPQASSSHFEEALNSYIKQLSKK